MNEGGRAPTPTSTANHPVTPIPLYAERARRRPGFFWLSER